MIVKSVYELTSDELVKLWFWLDELVDDFDYWNVRLGDDDYIVFDKYPVLFWKIDNTIYTSDELNDEEKKILLSFFDDFDFEKYWSDDFENSWSEFDKINWVKLAYRWWVWYVYHLYKYITPDK